MFLFISGVYAASWTSEVVIDCSAPVCIEGTPVNFTVYVANVGNNDFVVRQISLKDVDGIAFANAFNLNETLEQGKYKGFLLTGIVPPASKGSTIVYDVCYMIQENGKYGEVCDTNKRFWTIKPLSDIECLSDNDCYDGKVCFNNKCYDKKEIPKEENIFAKYIMYINFALLVGFISYFIYWIRKH